MFYAIYIYIYRSGNFEVKKVSWKLHILLRIFLKNKSLKLCKKLSAQKEEKNTQTFLKIMNTYLDI